ncbi:hypothetical protein SEUCBS139899_007460 [Sporothrix eucalyptigena]|uniref:Zn(2)-C6 fungal-type domain-containing protein n=1 Tax=Sporothrix eucalyptigena TaxID=1812306 RepID=A0ABP0B9N4_9PEZI
MDPNNLPMKRKRRRRTLACEECRRRKVRCDREQPCANCVQAYKPEHCFYQPDPMVTKSPPMRAGHVRKLSEGPGAPDRSERDSRGGYPGGPADRTGSLESDWPGSMTGTVTSSTSVTGASTPARFAVLPAPGSGNGAAGIGSGSNPYYRHDDQMSRADSNRESAFPSPGSISRGPLPGISAVSGESEVSSLKEQVRRLENRLALVINDQDEPRLPPPHHRRHSPHRGPHYPPPHHRPPHHHGPPHHGPPHHGPPHHGPPHHGPPHHGPPHHWLPFPPHYPGSPHMHPHHHDLPHHDRHDRLDRHDRHHGRHDRHDMHHPHQLPPPSTPQSMPPPSSGLPLSSLLEPRFEGFGPDPQTHRSTSPAPEEGGGSTKTRYISQGHWMNGALLTIMKPLLNQIMGKKENKNSELYQNMKKCKSLGRAIKSRRVPAMLSIDFGKQIPTREVADELINGYFRTFETVYRILHIPTFTRDYRRYWENPNEASVNFVVQMQLCMAIGTAFYDETCSLRHLAAQWIYEAQVWLMTPAPAQKARMNIPGLQTMCLMHLAREVSGNGGDLVWISAGELVRAAMYMGLHRDPTKIPKIPRYQAEIRRRLWATILEISLQSSLDSGGPPLLSLSDFDTLPPANFFDDQLVEKTPATTGGAPPPPKPLTTFTNTSIQIALLKSFPTRLAIARYVNDFRSGSSYDETLRLNSELRSACQALAGTIQSYRPSGSAGKLRPTNFQLRFVDHLTHRFFLSLNQAFLAASQNDPKFYFSRKVSVDTSLKLFQAWSGKASSSLSASGPSTGPASLPSAWAVASTGAAPSISSSPATGNRDLTATTETGEDEQDDFFRLSVTASSGFRSVPVQCIATLSMDLLWQLEEEHSVRLRLGIKSANGTSNNSGSTAGNNKSSSNGNPGDGEYGGSSSISGEGPAVRASSPPPDAGSMLAMPGVVTQTVLLEALEYAVRYAEKRLLAGETNVKGYLFPCAVVSQARALTRGADAEDMEHAVLAECTDRLKHCVDLLREVASKQTGKAIDDDAVTSLSLGSDLTMGTSENDGIGFQDLNNVPLLGGEDIMMGTGTEWGWEDLMQNQGFNFSFNMNGMDTFFAGI